MNVLREICAVTFLSIRSLPQRLGATLVTVIGIACVIAVLISFLAISAGVINMTLKNVSPGRVIVLSGGSPAEFMGAITHSDVEQISQVPHIKRDQNGHLMIQPMAMVLVEVDRKGGGTTNMAFRGTGAEGWLMNPAMRLIEGRMYTPALHEIVVGRAARAQFKNLEVGNRISLRGSEWTVVGVFEDGGGSNENIIVSDADTLLAAFGRNAYQSISVELEKESDMDEFRDTLTNNPQLFVQVYFHLDYYQSQVRQLTSVINFVAFFIGTVMAIGAMLGAVTALYSAVDKRALEIATLRAIGFSQTSIVVSVIAEALLLSVPGALIGVLLVEVFFNGQEMSSRSIMFAVTITPAHVILGIAWAVAIGLFGSVAPSIKAASQPIAMSMRPS